MSKQILHAFEEYQRARIQFVQTVADLSSRPQHIDTLQAAGVLALLRPLLLDNVPSIQQNAALALGRLANHKSELAESVVAGDILPQLIYSLAEQNRFYKRSAAFVLRAVAKHSAPLAQSVVDAGALAALTACLEDFDPGVKEAAAWALDFVARHTAELAQAVVGSGAVPPLVLCAQEPELALRRVAVACLSDIAKHTPELAQVVVDGNATKHIAPLLTHQDEKLKRQACQCLAQLAKHSLELAEVVVDAEIFPKVFLLLRDPDDGVQRNAATLIREVAKHAPELAQLIVNSGGVGPLVDFVSTASGSARLPGIMTLGYIAAYSDALALAVIDHKGIAPLGHALQKEPEDHLKAAAAWSLGQVGRHSADHAACVAEADVLPKLLDAFVSADSSDDLRTKAKRALKGIVQKCVNLSSLETLIHLNAPPKVLKHVCAQFAKLLPSDVAAKRDFVANGAFAKLQKVQAAPGSKLAGYIQSINHCYPPEIVQYYSPDYASTILEKIEADHGKKDSERGKRRLVAQA